MSAPRVAIVVLNWNRRDDTLACLASLGKIDYAPCDVIVVDNASTDDSVAAVRAGYPQVTLIELAENVGYVGGNNVGLERALAMGADYALLLNNDTEVAPDFLSRLVYVTEGDASIGIAGPTIYYYDQPDVVWSAGGAIDWDHGITRMIGVDEVDRGQWGQEPRQVDFVTGCALLIRAPIVRRLGMLDPRFFAYFEETEWCVRVTRAGYKAVHAPASHIWHKISPSSQALSPTVYYYMVRNRLLFLRMAHAGWRAWANTLLVEYPRTLLSWTLRPRWQALRPQRAVMLRAIRDFFSGRFGKVGLSGPGGRVRA